MRTFQQILEAAGYKCEAYSGRGMGGQECLATECHDLFKLFADVLDVAHEHLRGGGQSGEVVDLSRALRRGRTDNRGRDRLVVYFPGVEYES